MKGERNTERSTIDHQEPTLEELQKITFESIDAHLDSLASHLSLAWDDCQRYLARCGVRALDYEEAVGRAKRAGKGKELAYLAKILTKMHNEILAIRKDGRHETAL